MQHDTLARPDDETHRRINNETIRKTLRDRPALLRRLMETSPASFVRHVAQVLGLITEG